MKNITLFLAAVALTVGLLVGCDLPTPSQQQAVADQTAALAQQAAQVKAQLEAARLALQATTQPSASNPAPTPAAIAVEKKAEAPIAAAVKGIDQAVPVLTTTSSVLTATAKGENPGPVVVAAAPLFGPASVYVGMAGTVLGLVWGVFQTLGKNKAASAFTSAVDGVQAAIAAGQLVVTSAQAAATVDSTADSHPTNDRLVDVIAAAPLKA